MGPATVKSYAWPLITSPYLPAGNTKSSFSGLIISISEPSPNGATLKSYDMLRMVHVSCTFVVLAWPAALNVMARRTFAITRTETRSGALRRARMSLSNKTALAMIFKLAEAAERSWRRLNGHNQLPKIILGIKFSDGKGDDWQT